MPLRPAPNAAIAGHRRASFAYVGASIAVLLLVALHWAQPPTVVAQIDLPPPFDPANMLRKCAFAWGSVHTYFGSVDNCGSWYPYTALLLAMNTLFGPSYGQALVFGSTVILSWLGAYACARALSMQVPAAFLAGWAYAFNPARQLMFGEFATGEVCAVLLVWVIYWIIVAAREPERRGTARAALVAIACVPLGVLAATPQLLVALTVGALAVLGFAIVRTADGRQDFIKWAAVSLGLALAASLWWTLPNLLSYAGVAVAHAVSPLSVAWSFARASVLNELRFCASWVWQFAEYNPWSIEFERNAALYVSGFLPVAGLIVALIVCRGERLAWVRFFGALALVMLFIAKGVHPPLEKVNLAFYALPGMFMFIEPYGAVLIAALGLCLCCALGADALFASPSVINRRIGAAFVAASVAALSWNNLAAITGAIFHERMNFSPNEHITLAGEWVAAAKFLNEKPDADGVVVLPPNEHYQADYEWGYRGVDLLAIELLHRDVLMPGAPYWYTQAPHEVSLDATLRRLVALRMPLARPLLADLGIRYVLVRDDVHPVSHGLSPDPREYAVMLAGPPAAVFGSIEIYDIGPPVPRIARLYGAAAYFGDAGDAEAMYAAHVPGISSNALNLQGALAEVLQPPAVSRVEDFRALETIRDDSGFAIPFLFGRTEIDATSIAFDIFNPADTSLRGDVLIGVWPRSPTTYTLATDYGATYSAFVGDDRVTQWCSFQSIVLRPGVTHLILSRSATFAASMSAFLPPRMGGEPWRPHVNEVMFANLRVLGSPAAKARRSVALREPLLGMRLRVPLDDSPRFTIESSAGTGVPTMWHIALTKQRQRYTCVGHFFAGQEYQLADVVRDCFAGLGETLTESDASTIRIESVTLAGNPWPSNPPQGRIVASYTPLNQRAGGVTPSGTATIGHNATAATPLWAVPGLASLVRTNDAGDAPLVLLTSFSATWAAFDVRGLHVLPHWRAFGWQNAWDCPSGATVLVVNLLSALSLLLLGFGLALVAAVWTRR